MTSWPVTAPSPPVNWPGIGWMPFRTELVAVNDACTIAGTNSSSAAVDERVANATSDGELTRVGTCAVENVGGPEVRPTSESSGKTR